MANWNAHIIDEFRSNDGQVGGQFAGAPLLLLHTTGRRSGQERVNPVMYLTEGDRLFVFASKGGHPSNPDWFRNLVDNPEVTVELGSETFSARAHVVPQPERDRIYDIQKTRWQGFADYETRTTRVIPVVELVRS
jgi:deazaflavin-dependent oxidoreductase (nitroreductase family)